MSGAERVWRPLDLVDWTRQYFAEHGVPQPRLDAEVLLAHVIGCKRIDLYANFEQPVEAAERERYRELVRARATERVPTAYLIGTREFWSLDIEVTRDVLIPRPETELLVQTVAALAPARVAEIGVGSGAVLAALARELPDAELVGVDCGAEALEVARRNLERLGAAERTSLLLGDLTEPLAGTFDVVASNPPYVPTDVLATLEPELAHEPALALDGGPDGLDVVRRLVAAAPELVPGGFLALEIGDGQAEPVAALANEAGAKEVRVHEDLAGVPRVIVARFGREGAS